MGVSPPTTARARKLQKRQTRLRRHDYRYQVHREYYVHPRIISIETSVCGPFVRKAASAKESDRMQERDADIGKRFRLHRPGGIDDRQRAVMNYSHRNVELIAYNATVYVMRFREFVDIYAKTIYHLISKANCNAEICI